jgi:hypothetical protein
MSKKYVRLNFNRINLKVIYERFFKHKSLKLHMMYNLRSILPLLVLILLLTTSCTVSVDTQDFLKTNEQVRSFLELYPDSDMQIVVVSAANVPSISQSYNDECNMAPEKIDYYRATLTNTEFILHAWINKETQEFVCIFREQRNKTDKVSESQTAASIASKPANSIAPIPTSEDTDYTEFEDSDNVESDISIAESEYIPISEETEFVSECLEETNRIFITNEEPQTICFQGRQRLVSIGLTSSKSNLLVSIDDESGMAVIGSTTNINGVTLIVTDTFYTDVPIPHNAATIYFDENPQFVTEAPTTIVVQPINFDEPCSDEIFTLNTNSDHSFNIVCVDARLYFFSLLPYLSNEEAKFDFYGETTIVRLNTNTEISGMKFYITQIETITEPYLKTTVTMNFGEMP